MTAPAKGTRGDFVPALIILGEVVLQFAAKMMLFLPPILFLAAVFNLLCPIAMPLVLPLTIGLMIAEDRFLGLRTSSIL